MREKLEEYIKLKELETSLNERGFKLNKTKKAKLRLLELDLEL